MLLTGRSGQSGLCCRLRCGSLLVVVSTPSLAFSPRVVEGHEPVCVQTLRSELAVERFNEGIVGRLAWPGEVERDTTLVRPQIQIARHKLGTLVSPYHGRESYFSPDPFQYLHDVGAADGETRLHYLDK